MSPAPRPEREDEPHRPVGGQSHAWIQYWAGDGHGYGPTNRTRADDHHVAVGRGREYGDAPAQGRVPGAAGEPPEVPVEFTRAA
ncbi:hypothetical protein [Streptomyces sp. NPDC001340]